MPSRHLPSNRLSAASDTADEAPAFFRHHGFMAPGIRLLRSIGFGAKAAWVSAAFLIPILLLSWSLWNAASQNIEFSARERLGIEYARALMPLLDATQNRRRAAVAKSSDLDEAQQRTAKALAAVEGIDKRLGAELRTAEPWRRVQEHQRALASQPVRDNPVATFAVHTELIAGLLDLLNDVADHSNLTLDPDVETFYLMEAAVFKQPRLVEVLGQMRGVGNAVLRAGSITAAQRDQIASALAFAAAHQADLNRALGRATAADPTITTEVSMQDAVTASDKFIQLVRSQILAEAPSGDAAAYVAQANTAIGLHYKGIDKILDALDKRVERRLHRLQHELYLQLGIATFGIAIAIYLLVAFYRVTLGGISEVARQLDEISKGNLTLRPRPWGSDEVAKLMNTLASTLDSLRRIVGQVRAGAGEIKTASDEVAAASMDLSRRTVETAAHLQRTSLAMAQIGATVKHTAETASGAADMVGCNAQVAAKGGQEVERVVQTMTGIRDSSGRIADIIGTIDSIAFQTNILALNAAVEAARAGEQGRGFAVVASEVRALAQRSASAAREIKILIGASVEQVESGSAVVGQAGGTMQEVVGNAERIKVLIDEIRQGTAQQTAGLGEVGRSVEQLDVMTQQNAALVEETTAAASSLKDNAERLDKEMAFFRLV